MLAAGAMVASLLAVGAAPVGAQTTTVVDYPDYRENTSACVAPATDDQMFTDVSDEHAFVDAINCVAYYGITNGTGDGSTFSPNDNVTRAEMAVFIARAAEKAGADLGDAMSAGFSDIGDTWQEAQDAINKLATKGMIPKGGAFRPDADITRAEMATFLIGLLVKESPTVTKTFAGAIRLGEGGSTTGAADWDYFGDSRASMPAGNDAEISALYELGVTKGASPAAVQNKTKAPLDYNYEPAGTVNRGQMAEFIIRALAHTSVRPAGLTAQVDVSDVIVSVRDDDFQPTANITVDVFRIPTNDADVAFRANGTCGDVDKMGGTYDCEIDGADPLTDGDGDAREPLTDGVDKGGTTVWAWTGDLEDTVKNGADGLYELDVPEDAAPKPAARVRISTEYPDNKKAHLGSSVLYTVQLEDSDGEATTIGVDARKPRPAQFLVTTYTTAITYADTDNNAATPPVPIRNPQGEVVVQTLPLTTDADGKATFPVSGLPDGAPATKADKYVVEIKIQPRPGGNAPAPASDATGNTSAGNYYIGATTSTAIGDDDVSTFLVNVRVNDTETTHDDGLVFSTENSNRTKITTTASLREGLTATTGPGVTVKVKSADYVAASARGASNRATVSVTDQYGDGISGAKVRLYTSLDTGATPPATTDVLIGGRRILAVGRDGSYTFGYTREAAAGVAETLTPRWDDDNDTCVTEAACTDIDPVKEGDQAGTAGITGTAATVEWAAGAGATGTQVDIVEFDKETDTIFLDSTRDSAGGVVVLNYDENDRFNIGTDASSYAGFERALSKTKALTWTIAGSGSRAVNEFTIVDRA